MSAIKCLNPGCGGTDSFEVRPCYEWHRGFRWWQFWRGVQVYRVQTGYAVICTSCDTAMVLTANGSELSVKSREKLGVVPLRPVGSPESRSRVDGDLRREQVRAVEITP